MMLQIADGMRNEMLDYKNIKFYDLSEFLISKVRRARTSVKERFRWDKEKSEKLNDFILNNEEKSIELQAETKEIDEVCEKNNLRPYLFEKKSHGLILPIFGLILGFPLFFVWCYQ